MADQHIGFPGSVTSAQLALWLPNVAASQYSVDGLLDAAVTTNNVGDRGVSVRAGTVIGDGVMNIFEGNTQLNFAAVSAGSPDRWDMIVLRRLWNATPGSSTATYTIIQGNANRALPARNNNKGVLADQPIALCRIKAGSTAVQEIVDLRCWSHNGGVFARDQLVLNYMSNLGSRIKIGNETWTYEVTGTNGDSSSWVNDKGSSAWVNLSQPAGWVSNGLCRARTIMNGAFVHVDCDVRYTGGPSIFEGWILANLPSDMRPIDRCFVPGTTNEYHNGTFYTVYPGGIAVGPFPVGTICQLNGIAPLK
jgi:hypothetical protein